MIPLVKSAPIGLNQWFLLRREMRANGKIRLGSILMVHNFFFTQEKILTRFRFHICVDMEIWTSSKCRSMPALLCVSLILRKRLVYYNLHIMHLTRAGDMVGNCIVYYSVSFKNSPWFQYFLFYWCFLHSYDAYCYWCLVKSWVYWIKQFETERLTFVMSFFLD